MVNFELNFLNGVGKEPKFIFLHRDIQFEKTVLSPIDLSQSKTKLCILKKQMILGHADGSVT